MTDAHRTYYAQLVGATITGFTLVPPERDEPHHRGWPTFTVEHGDQVLILEVSRDEEGNGPGFLFIQEQS